MNLGNGSQLHSTNEALIKIAGFVFIDNALLTVICIGLIVTIIYIRARLDRIDSDGPTRCCVLLSVMVANMKSSLSSFLAGFLIATVMFFVGVASNATELPANLVQVLTFLPALTLTCGQVWSAYQGVAAVIKHRS